MKRVSLLLIGFAIAICAAVGISKAIENKVDHAAVVSHQNDNTQIQAIENVAAVTPVIENGFKISYPSIGSVKESKGYVKNILRPPADRSNFI